MATTATPPLTLRPAGLPSLVELLTLHCPVCDVTRPSQSYDEDPGCLCERARRWQYAAELDYRRTPIGVAELLALHADMLFLAEQQDTTHSACAALHDAAELIETAQQPALVAQEVGVPPGQVAALLSAITQAVITALRDRPVTHNERKQAWRPARGWCHHLLMVVRARQAQAGDGAR